MVLWHRSTAVAGVVLATLTLTACGGGGGGGPSPTATATRSSQGSLEARGKALAGARCATCHSVDGSSGTGPTWKGLAGSRVKLADGTTVTADDAYLTTAIEDPDRQIVAGYQSGLMSGLIRPGSISADDARALVAYIKTLR